MQRTTGDIAGRVADASGAPVSGASVTARDASGSVVASTATAADGSFHLTGLPAGMTYTLRVEGAGYAPASREHLEVVPDVTASIAIMLIVATGSAVVVQAPIGAVDPLAAGTVVLERRFIAAMPLFSRDVLQLAMLAPGFTGHPDFPHPQGQLYWTHNVIADGASHYSKWRSAPRSFASGYPIEAVDRVQIHANAFAVAYGDALASVTAVVTRAGSSRWNGSAFLFVHDDALDARPAFAPVTPRGSAQQAGGSLGGPLRGGLTTWTSYEVRRSRGRNAVVSPAAAGALVPDDIDEQRLFLRFDRPLGRERLITARYNGQYFEWHHEPGGLVLPGTGTQYTNDAHAALVTYRAAAAGTLVELHGQAARYVDRREDLSPTVYISRAGYSVEGGTFGPGGFGATPEDTWESSAVLSWTRGAHGITAGTGGRYVQAHTRSYSHGRGAYYFAGPPDAFPDPFLFVQGLGGPGRTSTSAPRSAAAFGFAEDTWVMMPRLTATIGVRYDIERISHVSGYTARADGNNVQPRVGVAWDLPGAISTVVRAAAGVYTQQHVLYPMTRVELEGTGGIATIVLTPDSPLAPRFPDVLPSPGAGALLPYTDVHRVEPALRNPHAIQTLAGVEHRRAGLTVGADYVTLRGYDLLSLLDANAPASSEKPAQRSVAAADATRPLVPVPGTYRSVITLGNAGRSWYRALQVKASRTSGALQATASYTLARADDMANYQLPEDSRNLEAEKGPAVTDVRHHAATAVAWVLPGTGPVRRGWTIAAVGMFRTGRPYTITWGDDRNGTTQRDARPGGRNTARTAAYRAIDLALTRSIPIGAVTIDARLEVFNVLNTTNYDDYAGQLLSPFFGQPVSAFPPRRAQAAVVMRF